MKKKIVYIVTAVIVLAGITLSVLLSRTHPQEEIVLRDYPDIALSGTVRAVTEYNSISYYVDSGKIKGFDYELMLAFAHEKGLEAEITPDMSFANRMQNTIKGKYDILASGTVVNSSSKDSLLFTHPIHLSKQVLVQRAERSDSDSVYIDNQLQLAGKTLYVVKDSPSLLRLHNLMNEIADTIYVVQVDRYGPEQLVAMVANGDIDYAVCDESIVQASVQDFPNLDIKTDISFTQFYSWGVNKSAPVLLDTLNAWLDRYVQTKEYKELCKRYFK